MQITIKYLLKRHNDWLESDGRQGLQLNTWLLSPVEYDKSKDFQGANLELALLKGEDFTGVNLRNADLRNADLGWVKLQEADLRGANLEGANLWGADFTLAKMTEEQKEYVLSNGAIINETY